MTDTIVRAPSTAPPSPAPRARRLTGDAVAALALFGVFVVLVLTRATALLEPDDYAYRASIVALSHGHLFLSTAQYEALNRQLAGTSGQGIMQWHHLAKGWISEKNPGYPYLAVLFYLAGTLRLAPIFYGALGCLGLYHGAKAWLGSRAGLWAVATYCFSGAALVFAWRDTMPTFTDASLIAAGVGGLLWVALTPSAPSRRRTLVGVAALLALDAAVFTRYTDVSVLLVALVAMTVVARPARLTRGTLAAWWLLTAAFGAGVLAFNAVVYGQATSTGYRAGEITFSLASFWPNLTHMPGPLLRAMPVWLLALGAVGWIAVRAARRLEGARRDAAVALALFLAWMSNWLLYFLYSWTVSAGGGGGDVVHVVRFYLPALGPIALLAAWAVSRASAPLAWGTVAVLVLTGYLGYASMASGGLGLPGGAGPGRGGPPAVGPGRPGPPPSGRGVLGGPGRGRPGQGRAAPPHRVA